MTEIAENGPHVTPVLHVLKGAASAVAQTCPACEESPSRSVGLKMEPMSGLEPLTYALRKRCSTD